MRCFLLLVCFCQALVFGQGVDGESEVRSYRVGQEVFLMTYHQNLPRNMEADPFAVGADHSVSEPLGRILEEAPFESRFLEGVESFWGCSAEMGVLLGEEDWDGMAVVDVKGGQLVVKAALRDHREIAEIFEGGLGGQIETEVTLYRVTGVQLGRDLRTVEEVRAKGEVLVGMSCLQQVGLEFEARSEGFVMKGEMQWWRDFDFVDNRLLWECDIDGVVFELKSGVVTQRGVPLLIELGALGGDQSLVAVMVQERILFDGWNFDEWILKEGEGVFLKEERLTAGGEAELVEGEGIKVFRVPPTFINFITMTSGDGEDDPFATGDDLELEVKKSDLLYEGNYPELEGVPHHQLYDVKRLLMQNGVSFQEGDFAVFSGMSSRLYVKVSEANMEYVEGIVIGGCRVLPRLIRLDFTRVEASSEVNGTRLEAGRYELKEKVGLFALPGQATKMKLGKGLIVEVEAQIDGDDRLVDMRARLARGGDLEKAVFKTGVVLRVGVPVVVQQSRVGEKWEAWVVTAEVVTLGKRK